MTKTLKAELQGLQAVFPTTALDHYKKERSVQVAGETALTLMVNERELVTLMTLGTHPKELALGYLFNQRLLEDIRAIESVTVDWERECVNIQLRSDQDISSWEDKTAQRIVTSGCGQGTMFSCTLDKLYDRRLPDLRIKQSHIYALLKAMSQHNEIYRSAGAVHGCALCQSDKVLMAVEDIGRHNASDAIAGKMWLENISGNDKIFYTTGRLTSEIVMKCANMGIPALLSRSGITQMGLTLGQDLNMTLIARAKGQAFLVYTNAELVEYDAIPAPLPRF